MIVVNDCRRQPLEFKQVKTFLAPPYLTVPPQTLALDPPLLVVIIVDHDDQRLLRDFF